MRPFRGPYESRGGSANEEGGSSVSDRDGIRWTRASFLGGYPWVSSPSVVIDSAVKIASQIRSPEG